MTTALFPLVNAVYLLSVRSNESERGFSHMLLMMTSNPSLLLTSTILALLFITIVTVLLYKILYIEMVDPDCLKDIVPQLTWRKQQEVEKLLEIWKSKSSLLNWQENSSRDRFEFRLLSRFICRIRNMIYRHVHCGRMYVSADYYLVVLPDWLVCTQSALSYFGTY